MLYGIPVTLLISGFNFPIGVVLYWTTTNLFSLGQQLWVLRKYPPPATAGRAPSTVPPIGGTPRTPATAKAVTSGKAAGSGKAAPARASADKAAAKPATTRFGRKPAVPPPAPVRETNKALAPKPGAKPANPKRGTSSAKQVKPAQTAESAEKSGTPAPKGTTSGQNGSKAKSPAKRTTG
jgi:YidC/Oxa1 family membrane protein insertase